MSGSYSSSSKAQLASLSNCILEELPAPRGRLQRISTEKSGTGLKSSPARLGYDTGHGDFCFGRLLDDIRKQDAASVVSGNSTIEIGSFVRPGAFPFFKLPFEIRRQIYKILCTHFFGNTTTQGYHQIQLRHIWWENPDSILTTPDELGQQGSDGRHGHRQLVLENTLHPGRKPTPGISYIMRAGQPVAEDAAYKLRRKGNSKDWSLLCMIRNLSNVSCQFRREFGEQFWSKTEIYMVSSLVTTQLIPFFKERPSIRIGLRSLNLYFDLYLDGYSWEKKRATFIRACSALSKQPLTLDNLHIRLDIDGNDLRDLLSDSGRLKFISFARKIPVSKTFTVCPNVMASRNVWNPSPWSAAGPVNHEKCHQELLEYMMPNTLRISKPLD